MRRIERATEQTDTASAKVSLAVLDGVGVCILAAF
jgi:hypothetical protein